jgi:anti-anti-sigma factor
MNSGQAYYTQQGTTYVIKLVGEIRYTMGCSLDDFLSRLFERGGYQDMLIDLTEVVCIDSTSLGLLAKVANFMRNRYGKQVTLVSSNPDINHILDNVGFFQIFRVVTESPWPLDEWQQLPITDLDKSALAQTMFEAHTVLSDLNPKNREVFKDVVDVLRAKLPGCQSP